MRVGKDIILREEQVSRGEKKGKTKRVSEILISFGWTERERQGEKGILIAFIIL